ncbi:MAG: hypothetical protein O3B27_03245 [Actinomycetota bacterium]|nr:hypothetical protein [Actinomycetota bacterium]MDA2949664.1 hypothetical protein [Actinomycetota bacterium]MDA2990564.1 hypothetical protein [Actinomycetota bacterium]
MTSTLDLSELSAEELAAELAKVQEQLAKARERRDKDAVVYASTPDGAAETYRRFELAPYDSAERKILKTTYLNGLTMAGKEHEERMRLGNAGPNDGPLAVIPVGDMTGADPLVKALVEQRVMGTFRNTTAAMDTGRVTVTLLRLMPTQERKRMRLDVEAEMGVFTSRLSDVIAAAWADKSLQKRLRGFLEDAADQIEAALTQRAPR